MAHVNVQSYAPSGATTARFHASPRFTRLIAGPIGSGKTTAACWDAVFTVMMQSPHPDGVRRAKVGILRDTYRNLYGTTLETWFKSFPREIGHFVGSDDRPFRHTLAFPAPLLDGAGQPTGGWGQCELIVEGRALGAHTVEATARGWELTGCFIDEVDLVPAEALSFLAGRVMRYPEMPYIRSRGVWGVFNKPDVDHWLYERAIEDRPANLEFFDQPAGLLPGGPPFQDNPHAENLHNLPPGYYAIAAEGQPEWYTRRMLRNEWGASISGEPIFAHLFRDRGDAAHILPIDLEPKPRDTLYLGVDGGGTPSLVVGGRTPTGRIIVYDELVIVDPTDPKKRRLMHGVGPRGLAAKARDLFAWRYANCRFEIGYGDPAAFYGADREQGEYAWMETLEQALGVSLIPAPSNEIELRLDAVRIGLTTTNEIDGLPNLQINPRCSWLRRGFVSDYKWEERDPKQPGKTLKPQKSATSHVHDADQYLNLGMRGRAGVTSGHRFDRWQPKTPAGNPVRPDTGMPTMPWDRRGGAESYAQDRGQAYSNEFDLWRS